MNKKIQKESRLDKGSTKSKAINEIPVVGIGASAGGLEMFMRFFDKMPANTGMAFVLIQHLSPDYKNLTAELLAEHTIMPVHQIDEKTPIEANRVYITPSNKDLSISQNILFLGEAIQVDGLKMPIDFFLRSLAKDKQENAICVILSGNGSDGTFGLKAIKDHGGFVIVQTPETASFAGMPRSALDTGLADCELPVDEIPEAVFAYAQNLQRLNTSDIHSDLTDRLLSKILSILRKQTSHDFSNYKKGTIKRRIERRMSLKHLFDFAEYADLLQNDSEEANLLFDDLLISVTDFFRDTEAYQQLESEVIRNIVHSKGPDDVIRVWIPGCASGEEVYSITIVILEQLQLAKKHNVLQIFASDIDERAISIARAGIYPINIAADVSEDRLNQFFTQKNNHYQVNKTLRESVVFARQNITSDPPFSNVDLISCRNLLIYLEPAIQKKIIVMFHFALNEKGYLFLGSSETIGAHDDLFRPICKKLRLYQRIETINRGKDLLPLMPNFNTHQQLVHPLIPSKHEKIQFDKISQQFLLQHYAPFSVLTNQQLEILYINGQSGNYLEMTTGKPSQDLISIAREGMRSKLRSAVKLSLDTGEKVTVKTQAKRDNQYYPVELTVHPVTWLKSPEQLLMVTFIDTTAPKSGHIGASVKVDDVAHASVLQQLEVELADTKEYLRTCLEDMATSNEQLKVSHEEVLSMNEELQSSNEELETSREELQSLNEELTTVNNQLQNKVEELASTNDDMANLLVSADIATVFLDLEFQIKRFTPGVCELFQLIKSDVGRPISDISHQFLNFNLTEEANKTLKNRVTNEFQAKTVDDKIFIVKISPFRTNENNIEGVVVTFFDITGIAEVQNSLINSKARIELLLKFTGEAIYGTDKTGKCTFVNTKLIEELGFTEEELIGQNTHMMIHHTHADGSKYPWSESFINRCLKDKKPHRGQSDLIWRKDGTSFPISYSVAPITENNELKGAVITYRDITEERASLHKLDYQARHDSLTGLVNRREFDERLERILNNSLKDNARHVLCYLDLDQFKVINDACGHIVGDELLRQLSHVLQSHVRKRDTLARLGGDEFGLLMEHCDLNEGMRVANDMRDAVANYRFIWQENTHLVGVSIGLVEIVGNDCDKTYLMKAADAACYAAKENGRNRVHVYIEHDSDMATRHGQMKWVARINSALESNLFKIALQPITRITGSSKNKLLYEVLIRMKDGQNIIQPDDFLGAAERYNLSPKLDLWVITNVFKWMKANQHKLNNIALININISGQSLGDKEFLKNVINAFKTNPVQPEKICFEITETAAIVNFTNANSFMHALKELGCEFALDDFGTGLSSFEYLKALPVDYIKIAGVFVKDIAVDPINLAMVKAIVVLGKEMGKLVIAESVESQEILDHLIELGVDFAQGFFVGKPVMLSEFNASIEGHYS